MEHCKSREDALMLAYLKCIAKAGHIVQSDIYRKVAECKSPKFWVSELRALSVLSSITKGDTLDGMIPKKREMYREIYRRFIEAKRDNPGLSDKELIVAVIDQEAPSFYLTPGTAKVMICKIKKRWFKRKTQN